MERKCSHITQNRVNKTNVLLNKFTTQIEKLNKQLSIINLFFSQCTFSLPPYDFLKIQKKCTWNKWVKQGLFWASINWSCRYVHVLMLWIFLNFFFTKKSAVQTAQLHESSVMRRHVWEPCSARCTATILGSTQGLWFPWYKVF